MELNYYELKVLCGRALTYPVEGKLGTSIPAVGDSPQIKDIYPR